MNSSIFMRALNDRFGLLIEFAGRTPSGYGNGSFSIWLAVLLHSVGVVAKLLLRINDTIIPRRCTVTSRW